MANKKVSQLTSKPSVLVTDLFPIADPSTGQLYKTTISDLGTAIGSGVSSVNGLVGAVVLDTDDIQELVSPTNKWFTDTRARAAISAGTGISYNSGTGVITNAVTSGQIATALGYTPANGSDYLPLIGGTLTGTLNGTNSFFSGGVTATDFRYAGSGIITFDVANSGTQQLIIRNGALSTLLTLNNSGALTTGSFIKTGGTSDQYLMADGSVSTLTNPVTGTGTTNILPKFTGASTIGDSNIQDDGSLITLGSNSYVNGALGVGVSPSTGFNLSVQRNFTGASISYGIASLGQIQSDVTTARYFYSSSSQASGASTTSIQHFFATQGTFLGTTTSQIGFYVSSTLIGATSNFAFRSDIDLGTNRWNLYMVGTANNYLAGSLGIGSTALTGYNLKVSKNITGSTIGYGVSSEGVIQSDVTSQSASFASNISTAAASFTLTTGVHYTAVQGTIGSGSAITTQYGYFASSTLIGATNNYAFFGAIPSGTNRWNLYMNGTANNYLAGSLGIGNTSLTGYSLRVTKNITGATTSIGIHSDGTIQSDVTGAAYLMSTNAATQAASFTLNSISHYRAFQTTFGAGSTVTNQYGFLVDASLTGATNNYGFFGNIASGTNRWNLYMAGTANNHLAGNLLIGSTADTGEKLQVTGNARIAKTVISSVSVGTIAGLGSSTVTIIAAKSGTISLAAQIIITGLESQNNGAIMITSNIIGNWSSGSLNKYGLGTTVSNESLGGNDYRGYGQLVPTVGTSGNSITLTLTNLQLSSISNISVSVIEYSN